MIVFPSRIVFARILTYYRAILPYHNSHGWREPRKINAINFRKLMEQWPSFTYFDDKSGWSMCRRLSVEKTCFNLSIHSTKIDCGVADIHGNLPVKLKRVNRGLAWYSFRKYNVVYGSMTANTTILLTVYIFDCPLTRSNWVNWFHNQRGNRSNGKMYGVYGFVTRTYESKAIHFLV